MCLSGSFIYLPKLHRLKHKIYFQRDTKCPSLSTVAFRLDLIETRFLFNLIRDSSLTFVRESITVWLTSSLTALYSIATDWIQSSQTGGQPYCCTYLYEVREYSLTTHVGQRSEKRCRYKICFQFQIVGRLVNVLQLLKT